MSLIYNKTKIIFIALLVAFSFVLFTQHINADTYSISGTIADVNYDSGTITIAPDDGSNEAEIKGFSGNQLKAIAKKVNDNPNRIYDFRIKNKNEIITYKYNPTATKNHDPYAFVIKWLLVPAIILLIILFVALP